MTERSTRRQLLFGIGAAGTVCLAGCTAGEETTTEPGPTDGTATTEPASGRPTEGTTTSGVTETGTTDGETANVRVAHVSPNAPAAQMLLTGSDGNAGEDVLLPGVDFRAVSDYVEVPAGEWQAVFGRGGDLVVYSDTVPLEGGDYYTLALLGAEGRMGPRGLSLEFYTDDVGAVDSGEAYLRLIHASPDAPTVDVTTGGDLVLFDGLSYGDAGYSTVPVGDYTVRVRSETDGNDGEALAEFDLGLDGGTVHTAFAVGPLSPDDEQSATTLDLVVARTGSGDRGAGRG